MARIAVLKHFLSSEPGTETFVRELCRITGHEINGIRRKLLNLEKAHILKKRDHARKVMYRLNENFPHIDALKALILEW